MSVSCEIILYGDSDEPYKAGSVVSGVVKYEIGDETAFNNIIVSLKGNGYLFVKHKQRDTNLYTNRKSEDYIDVDYIIYKSDKGDKLLQGSYQKEFVFILPEDIPPTFNLSKKTNKNLIHCYIVYYIRVKFEEIGITKAMKKFKKEFTVISPAKPRLPTEPTIYGHQKTLIRFSWKENLLKLNAMVDKSVRMPGDKIKVDYEIINDTNFNIRGVLVKLIGMYTFRPGKTEVNFVEEFKDTEERTGFIIHGKTEKRSAEITVPQGSSSIENANIISREYFLTFLLELPKHRDDVVFKIPIQITDIRPPPSYWEVLQESNASSQQDEIANVNDENIDISDDNTQAHVIEM